MKKTAVSSVFFRNVADGPGTDPFASAFGGLKDAVFFFYTSVKRITYSDQDHAGRANAGLYLNLASVRAGPETCFQRVFQKVGQDQAEIDLRYGEDDGQVQFHGERDPVPLIQQSVVGGHGVDSFVVAQIQTGVRDSVRGSGKVICEGIPLSVGGETLKNMNMMAHIVADLPGLGDGSAQIVIPRLLHGEQLIFQLETAVAVQRGSHVIEHGIKQKEQKQQGKAEDKVHVKEPFMGEQLQEGQQEQIQEDEKGRQDPEHIPRSGKGLILQKISGGVGGRIPCKQNGSPAHEV